MKEYDQLTERILNKLDKIEDNIASIDKTLERNTASLEYHILRTSQNEQLINELRKDLKPVENHVKYVQGALKLITFTGLIAGIALSLVKLAKYLF